MIRRDGKSLLGAITGEGAKKVWNECMSSLEVFPYRLQTERSDTQDVCLDICGWSFCVKSELGWFSSDAIHFTVGALSLAEVLLRV